MLAGNRSSGGSALRIGVDAAVLGHSTSGLQQYALNLLESLARLDTESEYVLVYVGLREGLERFSGLAGARWGIRSLVVPPWADRWKDRLNWVFGGAMARSVDVFFTPNYLLPLYVNARRRIVTVADLAVIEHPECFGGRLDLFTRRLRWSVRSADTVVAISEFTRQELIRLLRVPAERIRVVPCASHVRFQPTSCTDESASLRRLGMDFPYLLAVGTLQPRKNYVRLIEAFSRMACTGDVHLVIVGGRGWLDDEILACAKASPSAPRIHIRTDVSNEDLPTVYRGARAFCMPSIYEGFGIPLLEAMASGIPVASSRASSLPEVAAGAAEYFDPLDVEEMAHAIETVLWDEARRTALTDAGTDRAAAFTWERSARELLAVWTEPQR